MEVTISIKDPLLRAYLPGIFERRGSGYVVNSDTHTGSAISVHAKAVDYPLTL